MHQYKGTFAFHLEMRSEDSESTLLQKNEDISTSLKTEFTSYLSRAIRRNFMQMFGRIGNVKPAVLREMFKRLTGDASAESNLCRDSCR